MQIIRYKKQMLQVDMNGKFLDDLQIGRVACIYVRLNRSNNLQNRS